MKTCLERCSSAKHARECSAASEMDRPRRSALMSLEKIKEINDALRRSRTNDVSVAPHNDRAVAFGQEHRFPASKEFELAISVFDDMKHGALPRYTHSPRSAELRTIILTRSNTDAANCVIEQRPSPRIDLRFHHPLTGCRRRHLIYRSAYLAREDETRKEL